MKALRTLIVVVCIVAAAVEIGAHIRGKSADQDVVVVDVPAVARPSPNGADRLLLATGYMADQRTFDPYLLDHTYRSLKAPQRARIVKDNEAFVRVFDGALQLPYLGPPDLNQSPYNRFQFVDSFFQFDSRFDSDEGHWAEAADAGLLDIEFGSKITRGDAIKGMMAGIAAQAGGRSGLWRAIPHLNAAQARNAETSLQSIVSSSETLAESLTEAKYLEESGLAVIFTEGSWRDVIAFQVNSIMPNALPDSAVLQKRALLDDYVDYMDREIARAGLPYPQSASTSLTTRMPYEEVLVPGLGNPAQQPEFPYTLNLTENRLLLAALAIQAWRADHHSYPPALSALVPGYLSALPADPFAAAGTFQYKVTKSSYILYSIGPDGKDDGGKPIFDLSAVSHMPGQLQQEPTDVGLQSVGDIVAGVNENLRTN